LHKRGVPAANSGGPLACYGREPVYNLQIAQVCVFLPLPALSATRKDTKTMKTINIPGFTAEASLGSAGMFRARRVDNRMLATNTVRPAIIVDGGGGFECFPDDFNCVDCTDDITNIVCEECNAGGQGQCCQDPTICNVHRRAIVDCSNPVQAGVCSECYQGGGLICCLTPPCNIIPPPRTLPPPTCFRSGGRMICVYGRPVVSGVFVPTRA
jgi:hypothetical protein